MPVGRPTSYKPEFNDKVDEYLKLRQDTRVNEDKVTVKLPTIEGFAMFIGVTKPTLYDWETARDEDGNLLCPGFSYSLDKIRHAQQERLLDNGLSGDYNSTIAKLILSSNHGMSEKNINEQTGKDGGPIDTKLEISIKHV